jgi:hypothetical protein
MQANQCPTYIIADEFIDTISTVNLTQVVVIVIKLTNKGLKKQFETELVLKTSSK